MARNRCTAGRAAVALRLFLALPAAFTLDAVATMAATLVPTGVGHAGFISPAAAQPGSLPGNRSEALARYENALNNFKSILRQRRAQIEGNQPLPHLPGQALYLARNEMLSAHKDLTDAVASRIGRS